MYEIAIARRERPPPAIGIDAKSCSEFRAEEVPLTGLRLYAHRTALPTRCCTWWGVRSWREVASIGPRSLSAYCHLYLADAAPSQNARGMQRHPRFVSIVGSNNRRPNITVLAWLPPTCGHRHASATD